MKKSISVLILLFSFMAFSQLKDNQWIRAFPITDYMVDINDSVKLVQIRLPANIIVKEKQLGLLRTTYTEDGDSNLEIGVGRCHLIKGEYYYFAINYKKSNKLPKAGDLLYTAVDKSPVYNGNIVKLSLQYIGLKDVEDEPFYDRKSVFANFTKEDETQLVDEMVKDVQRTGEYFLQNNPEVDQEIEAGKNKGKLILNAMITCKNQDIEDFLTYITIKPTLYAGKQWKLSEVFATWLLAGAPTLIKE